MPRPSQPPPRASSAVTFILQVLAHDNVHLTSKQVLAAARKKLPAVNASTIYRALERLVQAGQVSVSDMGTGAAVYARVTPELHHHLICQGCGATMTIPHADVQSFFKRIQTRHRFEIATNHLVLFGRCERCQS